jgi:hypothetical protein
MVSSQAAGQFRGGLLGNLPRPPVAVRGAALVAGPVEELHRRVDVRHVADEGGLAQGRWESLPEAWTTTRSERCGDALITVLSCTIKASWSSSHRLELDFLVLEPFGRVDKHSQAQSGFDLQIEVAELELIHQLHRTVHSFQSAVGDEKKPVLPFEVRPGDAYGGTGKLQPVAGRSLLGRDRIFVGQGFKSCQQKQNRA